MEPGGTIAFGSFFVVMFLLGVVGLIVWAYALIDAIRTPEHEFRAGNQLMWVLVILLGNLVGALIYLVVGKPRGAVR